MSTKLAIAAVVIIAIGAAVAWAALRSPNQSVAGGQTTTTISPTTTNSTALTTAVETIPPSTIPPTTVAAPSSVAVASSEAPDTTAATAAPTDPVAAAATLAQQLADAFAAHDWTTARQISPTPVWSDAVYEQGFGSLTASRLVVARSEAVGSSVKLWLGEIAHEEVSTGPQVSLYCARWDVDIAKGTIARISGRLLRHTAGDAEPADAEAVERTKCA